MSRLACASRTALTLIELVVVLGILAVLSTIAVRSLEPIADQARYDLSKQLISDVREAIAGPTRSSLSRSNNSVSCFIFDTGALPSDVDELLDRPVSLIDRASQSFDSDRNTVNDVTLSSGWNGPYLTTGPGSSTIVDGWGNDASISESSGVLTIDSFGSDGDSVAPEDGYRQDLTTTVLAEDYLSSITFRLFAIDGSNGSRIDPAPTGTQKLGVLYYGVNATGGSTGAIAEQFIVVSNTGSFEHLRTSTLCGSAAARAILWDDSDSDDVWDTGETLVKKSIVHHVFVQPWLENRLEMELR